MGEPTLMRVVWGTTYRTVTFGFFLVAGFGGFILAVSSFIAGVQIGGPSTIPFVAGVAAYLLVTAVSVTVWSLVSERRDFDEYRGPDMSDANLQNANLQGTYLAKAIVRGVQAEGADFTGANLIGVDLTGAHLASTDFSNARLSRAHLDSVEVLDNDVLVNSRTRLDDVIWADQTPAQQGTATTYRARTKALREQSRVCRKVAKALRDRGFNAQAASYRVAEQRAERRAALREVNVPAWLGSFVLDLVSGYGEKPLRIIITYLVVVLGFGTAYLGIVYQWDGTHVVDALVYSLTSFHGRGFFPAANVTPHAPGVVLAAVEAMAGLFVELVLIATLSKRFQGN